MFNENTRGNKMETQKIFTNLESEQEAAAVDVSSCQHSVHPRNHRV